MGRCVSISIHTPSKLPLGNGSSCPNSNNGGVIHKFEGEKQENKPENCIESRLYLALSSEGPFGSSWPRRGTQE